MPVTFEPLPSDSLHGLDRPKFGLAWSPEMDRLHHHGAIMHQPPVEACSGVCESRLVGPSGAVARLVVVVPACDSSGVRPCSRLRSESSERAWRRRPEATHP